MQSSEIDLLRAQLRANQAAYAERVLNRPRTPSEATYMGDDAQLGLAVLKVNGGMAIATSSTNGYAVEGQHVAFQQGQGGFGIWDGLPR